MGLLINNQNGNQNYGSGFGLQVRYVVDTKSIMSFEIDGIFRSYARTIFSFNGDLMLNLTKPKNLFRPYLLGGLNYSEPEYGGSYENFISNNAGLGIKIDLTGAFLLMEYKRLLI